MTAVAERAVYRGTTGRRGFERAVRVIESFEPAVASEFVGTTDLLLREVKRSAQGDGAWTGGLLNRTGAPLEFSFGTGSGDLRYTVEAGGPETAPGRRLDVVDTRLGELGAARSRGGVCSRFREIQRNAGLRFGAWLGVRHFRNGRPTRFKIYAEVPGKTSRAASALASEYLGPGPVGPVSQPVLLGGDPGGDRCEFYYELASRRFMPDTLRQMLARVGLESRQAELIDLLRSFEFRGEGVGGALPEAQFGFSYSALPGGGEPAFSIFVFAADLPGGDGFLRRQVLASALGRGWTLGCYAAMTEAVAQRYFRSAYHNMISFAVDSDSMGFQVSVCPPPDPTEED